MKRLLIIIIIILLILSFAVLIWYAAIHARGKPVTVEKIKRVVLEVPFIDKELELSQGIAEGFWDSIDPSEIKLIYQVMVLPWPKIVTPSVTVKAFHNSKDIYFYISWEDQTQDRDLQINKFSDACAIMFPLGKEVQPSTIMMGFIGKANIWQWKASQDREYWNPDHRPQTRGLL